MEQLILKKKAEQYYQRCLELEKEGRYSAAILSCEWAIKDNPNNKEYKNKLEELKLQKQSLKPITPLEIANECYQKALKLKEERNYEKAIEIIKKAIELDSENIIYENELEELQILLNEQKEMEKCEEAIKEAKRCYKKVLKLKKRGEYKEALEIIKKAIELDPNNREYHEEEKRLNLAVKKGRKEKKVEDFCNVAACYAKRNEYDKAIDCYEKAIKELDSKNKEDKNKIIRIYEEIVKVLLKGKKCQEAIDYYNKILKLKPTSEYSQKIREIEEYMKERARKHYEDAEKLERIEDYEQAIKECITAIELDPYNTQYKNKKEELENKYEQQLNEEQRREEEIRIIREGATRHN